MIREDRYYVYVHRLVKDNSVFYVGHGTGRRCKVRTGRNKTWQTITADNAWYVMILKDGMKKREAEKLEVDLIRIYNTFANTHTGTLESKKLDQCEIVKRYYYDETSKTGLRYKQGNVKGRYKVSVGDEAGCMKEDQRGVRYTVSVSGRNVYAHRVVWFLCTGEDPTADFVIDHIDGDSSNNVFENLRKVTVTENNKNVKMRVDNKTGYKGISFREEGYYIVNWSENGVCKSKPFSCAKYGETKALGLAIEYRFRMLKNHCVGYTERHVGEYFKHESLEGLSEDDILAAFNCNLTARNKTGVNGLRLDAQGRWIFKNAHGGSCSYSVTKYGNDLAKDLANEYRSRACGESPKNIEGYSLMETNKMLLNCNKTDAAGLNGFCFKVVNTCTVVVGYRNVEKKKVTKHFSIVKLGLLEAIAEAIRWRKSLVA